MFAPVDEVPTSAFEAEGDDQREAPEVRNEVLWYAPMGVTEITAAERRSAEVYGETVWYAPLGVTEIMAAERAKN